MKLKTLLIAALLVTSIHGQEETNPFAPKGKSMEANKPKNISICYETFSLPLALAAKLQREPISDSDLYARLVDGVEKQTVRQETCTVLRLKSEQRATSESISEQIYPTEFDPPNMPVTLGVAITPPKANSAPDADGEEPEEEPTDTTLPDGKKPKEKAAPNTDKPEKVPNAAPGLDKLKEAPPLEMFEGLKIPAAATAFNTRNTGFTVEFEPTLDETEKLLDLRLTSEEVALAGHSTYGQGLSTVEMPIFECQRINTAATLHINQPFLHGTFNRPPNSAVEKDSANRVWFAFITGALVKP